MIFLVRPQVCPILNTPLSFPFISFRRAAASVLNDLASSAYYLGVVPSKRWDVLLCVSNRAECLPATEPLALSKR